MGRRRYISTDISRDSAVNRMAEEHGDFPALLYTWMIPHAEDDACLRGDVEEIMADVIPRRRSKTIQDVTQALESMEAYGLIEWNRDEGVIYFPLESFYKHQSYIKQDRRRKSSPHNTDEQRNATPNSEMLESATQNAEDQRKTPLRFSFDPHPDPHLKDCGGGDSAPAREVEIQIQKHYEQTFGLLPNEIQIAKLSYWCEKGMEVAVVLSAIVKARERGKDFGYIIGILDKQFARGIRTMEQAQMDDAGHDAKTTGGVDSDNRRSRAGPHQSGSSARKTDILKGRVGAIP